MFMNQSEIEEALARHRNHPVLSKATRLLYDLMDLANNISDGWCYWPKPCRAAKKLQEMIKNYENAKRASYPPVVEPTEADLKKAVVPIKAFLTREAKSLKGNTLSLPC